MDSDSGKEVVNSFRQEKLSLDQLPVKQWWMSKTYWLNIVGGVLNVVTLGTLVILALQEQDFVKQYPDASKYLAMALGFLNTLIAVANTVLRWGGSLPLTKMMSCFLIALTLLFTGTLNAQVVLDTSGAVDGTYYFKVVVVGGKSTISPLDSVVKLKDLTPGGPTSPTDPTTPPVTPFETAIASEVERITKAAITRGGTLTTGAALSSAYSLVSDEVAKGTIAHTSAPALLSMATDTVLNRVADKAAWDPWRSEVQNAMNLLQQQGMLSTKELMAKGIKAVARGMDKATGFNASPKEILNLNPREVPNHSNEYFGILDGINIQQLIELIKLIMELFKLFGGGIQTAPM